MTAARERLVRVVAEAMIRHQRIPMFDDTQGQRCVGCDHLRGATDGPNSSLHTEHVAEAVVAAMEAGMGLRVEVLDAHMLGDGVFHPASHRLVTDYVNDNPRSDLAP